MAITVEDVRSVARNADVRKVTFIVEEEDGTTRTLSGHSSIELTLEITNHTDGIPGYFDERDPLYGNLWCAPTEEITWRLTGKIVQTLLKIDA